MTLLLLVLACAPAEPGHATVVGPDSGGGDSAEADDSGQIEDVPGDWERPQADPDVLPDGMPTVEIEIDAQAMARLDADPWAAPDERGVFVDGDGGRHEVDLNYRGAYALLDVMGAYDLRNWKVKTDADDLYLGRREWNLNYEPHLRQKLAYDLFRFAGLAVPGAQHVVLLLNGEYQGMYLQYEDPDNTRWLADSFGDDGGDLYKAAFDIPYQPQCFGDLSWLGDTDADYLCHYANKTGDADDYGVLREFITDLNGVDDTEFDAWLDAHFDVEALRSYLVVSNFISNWDSYPQRPKNYWLYQDLRAGLMVFIPWDLDATFQPDTDSSFNQMGTRVSVMFNLVEQDYDPPCDGEGTERPLVRRLMASEDQRQAYVERYRELVSGVLSEGYLLARADALTAIVEPEISSTDAQRLTSASSSLRRFIEQRSASVQTELDALP